MYCTDLMGINNVPLIPINPHCPLIAQVLHVGFKIHADQ